MKKIFFAAVLLCFSLCSLYAQELTMSDFHVDSSDLSAQVHQVADLNGDPCALIKVGLTVPDAKFEGDIVKSEYKDGEYWVYLIGGSSWLTVKTSDFTPLRCDFESVKSKSTYIMTVTKPGENFLKPRITVDLKPQANIIGVQTKKPVSFDLLLVKPGMFKMGATPEQQNADKDEQPVHWVKITKDFYMGETEVTQALWEYVMDSNPSTFKDPNKPVEMGSWDECQVFLSKLSELTGVRFRLPTEAEWEYVARGGNKTQLTQYSGSANVDEVGWYYPNSQNTTHAVKTKKPNELGFYDMSGNVWEFCMDYKNEYPKGEVSDPVGSKADKNRVRRGGAWDSESPDNLRVAFRRRVEQDTREKGLGLRVVLDLSK